MTDFHALYNVIEEMVTIHDDKNGALLYINDAGLKRCGLERSALKNGNNAKLIQVLPTLEGTSFLKNMVPLVEHNSKYELKKIPLNGHKLMYAQVSHYKFENKRYFFATWKLDTKDKKGILLNTQRILDRVARVLNETKSEPEVYNKFLKLLEIHQSLSNCGLYLIESETLVLKKQNALSFTFEKTIPVSELQKSDPIYSAIKNKSSYFVNPNGTLNEGLNNTYSILIIPIILQDKVQGILFCKSAKIDMQLSVSTDILETSLSFFAMKIMQLKAIEKMTENEERLSAILNASPDLVFILSENGVYLEIYTKNEGLLSAKRNELIGSHLENHLEQEELSRITTMLKEVVKYGKTKPIEYNRTIINGDKRWFSTNASRLLYKGQSAILLVSRDITEKVNFRKKLIDSENLVSSIHKNISDGIYRSFPNGDLVYVNQPFATLFGYDTVEEMLTIKPSSLYANPSQRMRIIELIKENDKIDSKEILFKRKDGSTFWGEINSSLTKDVNGQLIFDGAVRDITKKINDQNKIRESQKLLASINRNISEGIYRSYAKGGLIYVNAAFAEMFGYSSPEELLKLPSTQLYANPNVRVGVTPELEKTGFKTNHETLFKRKDGSTFWGSNSYILTTDDKGNKIFDGAVRNISEAKEAAENLQRLNDELTQQNKKLAIQEKELALANQELTNKSKNLLKSFPIVILNWTNWFTGLHTI